MRASSVVMVTPCFSRLLIGTITAAPKFALGSACVSTIRLVHHPLKHSSFDRLVVHINNVLVYRSAIANKPRSKSRSDIDRGDFYIRDGDKVNAVKWSGVVRMWPAL